jgi:DtxR family transcriptional regulator, Mn-dependent transcriptional regulator
MRREDRPEEQLCLGTVEAEHIEMYLKALWYIREKGQELKISSIAQLLNITQPSVVQMLQKLDSLNLVRYTPGEVQITPEGESVGKQMVRNTRLLECL